MCWTLLGLFKAIRIAVDKMIHASKLDRVFSLKSKYIDRLLLLTLILLI